MPSPFPGMNPYFETADSWSDFHERYLVFAANALGKQVGEEFYVRVNQNVYGQDASTASVELIGRPDVYVARSTSGASATPPSASATPHARITPASTLVRLAEELAEEESFLEIRDRRSREVITVIELLSPTNKQPGEKRDQFLAKRRRVLASQSHYVEIDFLRGWPRLPLRGLPVCDYYAMVSRAEMRPNAELWTMGLRDGLPTLPIPLREGVPDAPLDLQALLHDLYDAGEYRKSVYDSEPEPPLSPADTAWARTLIS